MKLLIIAALPLLLLSSCGVMHKTSEKSKEKRDSTAHVATSDVKTTSIRERIDTTGYTLQDTTDFNISDLAFEQMMNDSSDAMDTAYHTVLATKDKTILVKKSKDGKGVTVRDIDKPQAVHMQLDKEINTRDQAKSKTDVTVHSKVNDKHTDKKVFGLPWWLWVIIIVILLVLLILFLYKEYKKYTNPERDIIK